MRILLCGKMGSGKSTVSNRLCNKYGFYQLGFGDKVKEIAREIFPEEFSGGKKPRKLLQWFGTDAMRSWNPDCWTNYLMRQIDGRGGNIVIDDGRFTNELNTAVAYGFTPVLVIAPKELRRFRLIMRDGELDKEAFGHISETDLDSAPFSFVLDNGQSKRYLCLQIDELIRKLSGCVDIPTGVKSPAPHSCADCGRAAVYDDQQCCDCLGNGLRHWVAKEADQCE